MLRSVYILGFIVFVIIYDINFMSIKSYQEVDNEFNKIYFAKIEDSILTLPALKNDECRYLIQSTCVKTGDVRFISVSNNLHPVTISLDGLHKDYKILKEKCFNRTLDVSDKFKLQKIITGLSTGASYDYFLYKKGVRQ